MHISGVGTGGVLPDPPLFAAIASTIPSNDSVGSALEQLSAAPIAQLLSGIAASHPAADPTVVTDLLHAAAAAVVEGNVPLALTKLTELIHRSPEHAETLAAEPSLAGIHAQVEALLTRLSTVAKMEAEVRLVSATALVDTATPHNPRSGDWNPRDVLPVAAQLIDSGRHSNILLAPDLSQAVIAYYGGIEIASTLTSGGRRGRPEQLVNPSAQAPWSATASGVTEVLKNLWKRSPALLLLLIWALLGIVSAIAAGLEWCSVELSLEVWGAGSAGLLGFGTYRRLRAEPTD